MACTRGPGDHRVEFVFADTPIRFWAKLLSCVAALALIAAAVRASDATRLFRFTSKSEITAPDRKAI